MFTIKHRRLGHALGSLTAVALAVGLVWVPPGQAAARFGAKPSVQRVQHFQTGPAQVLRWSEVGGATAYQVFVKGARYDKRLRRNWTLLKTVRRTSANVRVRPGRVRQFGVRAVGAPDGMRRKVTRISNFGVVSRPARLSALTREKRWRTVRKASLYRNVALEASRRGAKLRLRDVRAGSSVRLVAVTGRKFGKVDVYVGSRRIKRVNLGAHRHDPDRRLVVLVRPARRGTISLVTRTRKPVRISAIGHTRRSSTATVKPRAPLSRPPASSFTFRGSGWGHGVGLSQYGAKAMADVGRSPRRILRHYYQGTRLDRVSDDKVIDVNVGYHASSLTVRLRGLARGAEARVCAIRAGKCARRATIVDRTRGDRTAGRIALVRRNGKVRARVTQADGDLTTLRARKVRVRWSGTGPLNGKRSVIRLGNGREYRHGQLVVTRHGTGLLNAKVRMRLQSEYLRGVAEMPSSWNLDALRAQAIIARTYALKTGAGRKADCDCHLRDSVVHQAYVGWGKETEGRSSYYGKRWVKAVNSTDGRVLTYRGRLAGTYYFSSSGGHTLNSQDVWSSKVPYLQSVDDPGSLKGANPNRSWSNTRSTASMASLFGLRSIHAIQITRKYPGGAVRSVKATAKNGDRRTISGKADYMRSLLGTKSAWVTSINERY